MLTSRTHLSSRHAYERHYPMTQDWAVRDASAPMYSAAQCPCPQPTRVCPVCAAALAHAQHTRVRGSPCVGHTLLRGSLFTHNLCAGRLWCVVCA